MMQQWIMDIFKSVKRFDDCFNFVDTFIQRVFHVPVKNINRKLWQMSSYTPGENIILRG